MSNPQKKRRTYKKALIMLVAIFLILIFRLVEYIGYDKAPGDRFVIMRVIDGDTVELAGGDRLRLLGIDTPEKGELYYDSAAMFLESLVLGQKSRIEYADKRRDRYGRLLGFVYVEDTIFVNRRILSAGLGYLYLVKDQELSRPRFKELLVAQRQAVGSKIGLWGIDRDYEDRYIASKLSLRFHRPGCSSASRIKQSNIRTFENMQEPLYEGLSPCRICRP
ncbi:MAG: thermonuclease family protein [candidate division Zixibacteria bacterium]|nr:thermonuclease family protein [candidate division Zixibacteria bacterium]